MKSLGLGAMMCRLRWAEENGSIEEIINDEFLNNKNKLKTITMKKLIALLAVVFISANLFATQRTWVGNGSNKNWNTASNWSPSSVPGSSDTAYFDGSGTGQCIFNVNVSVFRFEIKSGYTDTVKQNNKTLTVGNTLKQTGGVFWGDSTNISSGAFTLTGGIFRSTKSTLTLTYNSNFAGGTFIHNNGTAKFYPSLLGYLTITGPVTFYDLTFASSGNTTITIASGTTISADGDMTISGSTVIYFQTGSIDLYGDLYMNNTALAYGEGSATISFKGSAKQHLYGSSVWSPHLPKVVINKSGDTLFFHNDIYVANNWTHTAGIVDADSSTVHFDGVFTISGSMSFYNAHFIGGTYQGGYTIASGTTLTVNGTLTIEGVQYAVGLNTGDIYAKGNVTVSGGVTGGGGTATITINGTSGNQTFTGSGTAGKQTVPNIIINKSSGTLTLASIISCAGNWTYTTAGAVSAGSSTVAFYGTKNTDGEGTSATMSFNHVEINTGTRTLTGNFIAAGNFTIASGATLTQNDKNMNIGGNWSNSGTYTTNANDLVTFDGSGAQSISKTTSPETFYNVTMNKSGNTLTLNNTSIVVNEVLTFTLGTITTGSYNVKLIAGASTTGAATATGFVIGNVKKVGSTAFTFPVGDATSGYHPIAMTAPSSASDEFEAKYFYANPQTAYGSSTNLSNCEYWTHARNVGSSTPTLTLNWNSNSCNINSDLTKMLVAHWNGSSWDNLGNGGTTGTQSSGSVATAAAVTSFTNGFALAQCPGGWTQMADFGGTGRRGAVGFSIGSYGYIGTGEDDYGRTNDFLRYDPAGDTWTQKANFGGAVRYEAVGFSIGTKGYIGTGVNSPNIYDDFWEYDPTSNTWTQRANYPGGAVWSAVGFSIGTKGYLATGYDGSNFKNDIYEYDPSGNSWTQKTNFAGAARYKAQGFSIGSKGYVGTGNNSAGNEDDFWEYDPSPNTWTQKADYFQQTNTAVCFSIGTKGYINSDSYLHEWDQATNVWTRKADFPSSTYDMAGFSIGTKGYIGTGISSGHSVDFWEYDPDDCGSTLRVMNPIVISNNEIPKQSGKIYPNPAGNEAILDYTLDEGQIGTLELYSVMGQKVISYALKPQEVLNLHLSGVQTGIYFFIVKVNGKIKYSDKLVVVK